MCDKQFQNLKHQLPLHFLLLYSNLLQSSARNYKDCFFQELQNGEKNTNHEIALKFPDISSVFEKILILIPEIFQLMHSGILNHS